MGYNIATMECVVFPDIRNNILSRNMVDFPQKKRNKTIKSKEPVNTDPTLGEKIPKC